MKEIFIDSFAINKGRTFIIAELSANHAGDYDIAKRTIDAARDAGADAIKLQTYTADTLTIDSDKDIFKINSGTLWDGKRYYDLYKKASTPWEWQPELKKYAESLGLILFSSPFDQTAADFLESMDVPAYKIASFEITDIPLIRHVARKKKPVLISTGIAELEDIELAIETIRNEGNDDIILLKCTSSYPAPVDEANLRLIPDMAKRFGVPVGLSDHTTDNTVAVTSVALGACVIEKHIILDKNLDSADAAFSMTPDEFKSMISSIRTVESALGHADYTLTPASAKGKSFARSLYAVSDIEIGEKITYTNIRSIRPAGGLHPKYLDDIVGMQAGRKISRGEPIAFDMLKKINKIKDR